MILALILAFLVPLWVLLRRNFISGFAYAVFLCVSMTTFLRIELPGNLPQLTIHRLILVSLFVFWLLRGGDRGRFSHVPFFPQMCFWVIAGCLSLMFTSINFVTSLKRVLDLVIEVWLYYLLLATTLRDRDSAIRILRAAWLGAALVAILAVTERYTGFNPVHWLNGEHFEGRPDVVATYQHRILLGTGMAMAFPLAFALMLLPDTAKVPRRFWLWSSIGLFFAASYYAQSRGPWLAAMLAGGVLMIGAGRFIRSRLIGLGFLAILILALRPGIYETLSDRAESSADSRTFKGGTLLYRIELWKVAWYEVSQSPDRLLFGYGPGCGSEKEIEWTLSYRNQQFDISSWDNQFAYDLYQSGLLGLCASVLLYGAVLRSLYRQWRFAPSSEKGVRACLFASALALVFMMTNVMIFAKQLHFMFWTVVAVSSALADARQGQLVSQTEPVSDWGTLSNEEGKVKPCAIAPL